MKYDEGDHVKEDEMGTEYVIYGRGEMHTEFWRGNKGRRPLGRQRRGGENTVMSLDEVGWEGLWGIAVAEDREKSWPQYRTVEPGRCHGH